MIYLKHLALRNTVSQMNTKECHCSIAYLCRINVMCFNLVLKYPIKPWLSSDVIICLKNAMSRLNQNMKVRPKAMPGYVVLIMVLHEL